MKRTLSSGMTFFYKFIMAPLWIVLAFVTYLGLESSGELEQMPSLAQMILVIAFFIAAIVMYRVFADIKKVDLEGTTLIITNFRDTLRIDLREVKSISGSRFTNPERVRIHFHRPTIFGDSIVFIAPNRSFSGFSKTQVQKELEGLISQSHSGQAL